MKKNFDRVYQFKISLSGIRPPIWRRIQVPETYSFWDLHIAIQDVMGWDDCHLHEFRILSPILRQEVRIGIPVDDHMFLDSALHPCWEMKIADYFTQEKTSASYVYDFGDGWIHKITLEKIILRDKSDKYPTCIKGKRACPPEDCGGVGGYYNLLEIIKNPEHERYREMTEWLGEGFNPECFDIEDVSFDNPDKRYRKAFG